MSVRVQVTDKDSKVLKNVTVTVKWQGSTSERKTNNSGIADMECSGGTIEYIQVWDEKVCGRRVVGNDEIVEVISTKYRAG